MQINNMTRRIMRRWLNEIAALVNNPATDIYSLQSVLQAKFQGVQQAVSVPASKSPTTSFSLPYSGTRTLLTREQLSEVKRIYNQPSSTSSIYGGKSLIAAIRQVRTYTGLGLKEAKELVEGLFVTTPKRRSSRAAFRAVAK